MQIEERLEKYLQQLEPHIRQREPGELLVESLAEIKRLRDILHCRPGIDGMPENYIEWSLILSQIEGI